jgi:hypothetical protein
LPQFPGATKLPINLVGGSAFDRIHNFAQSIYLTGLLVNERREDHVHVVRHYDDSANVNLYIDIVKATP